MKTIFKITPSFLLQARFFVAGGVALLAGALSRRPDPTEVPGPEDVAGGDR